jgi:hypothetical protein
MSDITSIYVNKEDLGKNLYRKKTYYTLCIEQDVLAKNKDEADTKFTDFGGINHSEIGRKITDENDGVETYMVDANYTDSDNTEYVAKVVYDDYDTLENAVENGDVQLDTYVGEKDVIKENGEIVEPEDSKIDTAINLENESMLGK